MVVECKPFVITISHQVGSGGARLGQKLSEQLHIPYIDREILRKVAEQLNLAEAELANREERLVSFWQSFARMVEMLDPAKSLTADSYIPTDKELFQLESDYIGRIAEKSSAIFLGRCGKYILRDHPCRISVLVYADMPVRVERISEQYRISTNEAKNLIETSDRERAAYIRAFTRQDLYDARLYDLCINTASIELDKAVELVIAGVKAKN